MNTPIALVERDHPGNHDPAWLDEVRRRAAERADAQIPTRYADAHPNQADVCSWVRTLVADAVHQQRSSVPTVRTGPSLLLLGPTGVGKTHQAYGALHALAASGVQCGWIFTTAADLYARLRPRHGVDSEQEFSRYAATSLLMLDDLGAAKGSEWVEEINYRLVNHRYEHMLPTLITSNVPAGELGTTLGERVASRLVEMTSRAAMTGEDRRKTSTS